MELLRVRDVDGERGGESMRHYKSSFPIHEQRSDAAQEAVMESEEYQFNVISDADKDVGALLCWETEKFIYVEHFYIYPHYRGEGWGSRALEMLCTRGKTVILEIDPPVDEVAIRRKRFYERCGFAENDAAHIHPPYREGYEGHELTVMSYPRKLTAGEYEAFNTYLRNTVMKYK